MAENSNVILTDARTTAVNMNDIIHPMNNLQLNSVLDELTTQDYISMLFLLMNYIGEDDFLNVTKENKNVLRQKLDTILRTIDDDAILLELFSTLKLYRKLKTIGTCQHIIEKYQCKNTCSISEIWKMLYSLCEELDNSDLEGLKQHFPPDDRNKIKTAEEWFCLALKKKLFSKSDFSKLEHIFRYHRKCLAIIRNYERPKCFEIRTPTVYTPCGFAVILNYEDFGGLYKERKGSNIDVDSLKEVWKMFGFKTRVHNNLTYQETFNILQEYANFDHSDYDAFVCCILSHGLSNVVISSDGIQMLLPDLIAKITNNCSTLNLKPKLFFVQACQGDNIQEGIGKPVISLTNDTVSPVTPNSAPPIASDLLLAMSSIDGYVSFRSPTHGSWFIEAFCQVMKQKGDKFSILDIMIEVNNLVRERSVDFGPGLPRKVQQIVNCYNTFSKTLILKKKTL